MKKQIYFSIALALVILGVSFYWFALRPAEIKRNCSSLAQKLFQTDNLSASDFENHYNFTYSRCLEQNGL